MTKIIMTEDCGNSPKNILVRDMTIAFARGNVKSIMKTMAETIRWNMVGDHVVEGMENLSKFLKGGVEVQELTIHHIATHGKAGAVNGTRKLANGKTFAFCDVYEFSNAKGIAINEITSYVIEI